MGGIQVNYYLSVQQMESGWIEKVTRLVMRDGIAAQGACEQDRCQWCAENQVRRWWQRRHFPVVLSSEEQLSAGRRSKGTKGQQGKQRHTHKWRQAIPPEPIRGDGGTQLGSAAQLTLTHVG